MPRFQLYGYTLLSMKNNKICFRFVYHELSSTKIDNKVMFPLEGLDLSDYISGPGSSDLIYDLQSCVLHFGGCPFIFLIVFVLE